MPHSADRTSGRSLGPLPGWRLAFIVAYAKQICNESSIWAVSASGQNKCKAQALVECIEKEGIQGLGFRILMHQIRYTVRQTRDYECIKKEGCKECANCCADQVEEGLRTCGSPKSSAGYPVVEVG